MAISDFTGQNIQDTYQRVVQTDGTNLADGTGSIFIPVSSSHAITASHALFAISASHEITLELSSSHAQTASFANDFTVSKTITADKVRVGNPGGSTAFDIAAGAGGIDTDGAMRCTGFSNDSTSTFGGRIDITGASSYVQTESYISASQLISSGHITASGNISASGDIIADDTFTTNLTLNSSDDSTFKIFGTDLTIITHEFHGRGNSHSFLAIPTTQNLGIGLNNDEIPQAKLHVSGNISASGDLIVNNINGTIDGGTF